MLLAVQIIALAAMTVSLARQHETLRGSEIERLQRRAKIIDDNLSQQVEAADKALRSVADTVAGLAAGAAAAPVTAQLKSLTDAMPGFRSMLWLGPDGTVRATSNDALLGRNFATREYFAAPLRVGDPVRLYVSPPFLSSLGTHVIVVSRLLIDSQGAFDGVVAATLDPAYFRVLLQSVLSAPDMQAALVHENGAIFLEVPADATGAAAQPPELPALLAAYRRRPDRQVADIDGTRIGGSLRLVGLRSLDRNEPLHDQALVAMVSRDLSAVLVPWHEQMHRDVALLVVLVLLSSASLWLDQRRRRENRAANLAVMLERQTAAERLEQALRLDIADRRNAETKLLLSERRLKAVNDNVPAIVAHLDLENRYLTANEEFRRIFGIDPATMVGRTLREIRGEAVFAQMEPQLMAALQGETRRFELTDTIDGIRHHFQHNFIPDLDDNGRVQGFYSVAFDITDLRRSEELLLESSARHRAIVEEQSELVSLAREDGELIYVNRAHARQFGRPAAALVGENLLDLVVPADRQMARSVIANVFATGHSRSGDSRVLSADGTERWVAWTNTLQRDAHGGVLLRSVGRDITEQRRAERALRASQRFLSRTGRVAGVGGWEVDLENGTLTWSEQVRRIHEVADDYVPTLEGAIDFYAPEARPAIRAAVENGISTGESWDLELPLVTATGRHAWVRAVGDVELMQGKAVRLVGAFQDITARKRAEQAIEHQKRLLHTVTDNLPVFILYIDHHQTVLFLNATAEHWLKLPPGASVGRHLSEVLGPDRYEARRLQVDRALGGESLKFEVQGNPAGRARDLEQHYIPDVGADGSVRGLFAMVHDITEAKETQRKLEEMARVDTLTGLPNRRQFDEKLEEALRRSRRTGQHLAVMFLDIDHFKAINDSLGHAGGDAVLEEFAARLTASVRETDLAARLGGDEFVVLLEGLTLADDAAGVAEKVVDAMRVEFRIDGSPLHVTTSLGIGFSSDATCTAADLLACADHALYEAKREGRDGFRLSNFGVSLLPAPL